MRTRIDWERLERTILAPFAQKSGDSKGRAHPEAEHPYRMAYQRDRERIIHSRAFRRLEYKTQVFVNHEGDHYRTRLTHSMEAATISRTLARALALNEDLAEAIALAHDLGHPPFGHSGEAALNKVMQGAGGFEHNKQSLRVVELLERKYPTFSGLNLTWEVREGIAKHRGAYEKDNPVLREMKTSPSLEAQLVDRADEIAYNCHDLDDGLASGLIHEAQLKKVAVWQEALAHAREGITGPVDADILRYYTVRSAINLLATDLAQSTRARIKEAGISGAEEARNTTKLVDFSPAMAKKNLGLKRFLHRHLYGHSKVAKRNELAIQILRDLFQHYLNHPERFQESGGSAAGRIPLRREICDYIAGMTDRFAIQEHSKLIKKSPARSMLIGS